MAMSALSCMRVDTAHTERWRDGTETSAFGFAGEVLDEV